MPFERGRSGTPGGWPKTVAEVRAAAQQLGVECAQTLTTMNRKTWTRARVQAAMRCSIVTERAARSGFMLHDRCGSVWPTQISEFASLRE